MGVVVLSPVLFGFTVLVLALTPSNTRVSHILNDKRLQYLGMISFSIYLTHAFVWWIVRQFLRFVVEVPTKLDSEGRVVIDIQNPFL